MELYRLIASTEEGEIPIVAAAESEAEAFRIADREIQHHYLKKPKITDIALIQRKSIGKNGAGYLIRPRESYE
ncbi:DUF3906 family protein [Sporolactobacillus shoreae]|uniref:DUF3906 family protein n=1 Tax=Sporolactobacillus shoreae TaxID=1465501 RepID=A0A4Z0GRI5_9BACL|nr:DUF3906 family protein [Sporolactobacillus shoreae]TGA99929.1 DUF3906 family protein [Sporolactobacillus shoreae]